MEATMRVGVQRLTQAVLAVLCVAVLCVAVLCVAGCAEGSAQADAQGEFVADLLDADRVSVADLSAQDAGASVDGLLAAAAFETAAEADARSIATLLGTQKNYMDTGNACFDNDVAIRFHFPAGQELDAIIGLTCWNVQFVAADKDQATPEDGYLTPGKLQELATTLKHVVPSLDVTHVGD